MHKAIQLQQERERSQRRLRWEVVKQTRASLNSAGAGAAAARLVPSQTLSGAAPSLVAGRGACDTVSIPSSTALVLRALPILM